MSVITLIPTRYNPPPTSKLQKYSPYCVLWLRVIIRAGFDYALWKDSSEFKTKKIALDAQRWLFEPSTLWSSFENICDVFNLPKERLRLWAESLTRENVRKMEFCEREGKELFELAPEPTVSEDEDLGTDGDDQ